MKTTASTTLHRTRARRVGGMTLVEVVISMAVFGLIATAVVTALVQSITLSKGGSAQVGYLTETRIAQQQIMSIVHRSIRVGPATYQGHPALRLDVDPTHRGDLTHSFLWYEDGDGNPLTHEDNRIMHDPDRYDLYIPGGEREIIRNVSLIGNEPVFDVVQNGKQAGTARFRFHVGDNKEADLTAYSDSGKGYQGVEIRFSASPRDLHDWKRWNELGIEE